MRKGVIVGVLLVHALVIAVAGSLPDTVAPVVAGSIYLPLWPWSALGLPVYAGADAGGWSSPSLLGWAVLAMTWCAVWSVIVVGLARR